MDGLYCKLIYDAETNNVVASITDCIEFFLWSV